MTAPNGLVDAKTVAEHFGVTVATVRTWARRRQIPCIWVSRTTVRFRVEDIERALTRTAHRGAVRSRETIR